MHFAYVPRKAAQPPPYTVRLAHSTSLLRRRRLHLLALLALGGLTVLYLLFRSAGHQSTAASALAAPPLPPPGTAKVVIVTMFDKTTDDEHRRLITANREAYATRHAYATFFPSSEDYNVGRYDKSWAKLPALRHALKLHPHSTFFWYLSPRALITNGQLSLEAAVLDKAVLERIMIPDVSVVPPDSVIKTFPHIPAERIHLILTQDREGLSQDSFILRQGDWARYLLDAWFDPLYRSYNFQKAEVHALEHIVQWHVTILAKLALVPLKLINAYTRESPSTGEGVLYGQGDLVANFGACDAAGRSCVDEMGPFVEGAR